jgi:L,D-transpeptidase YcbB
MFDSGGGAERSDFGSAPEGSEMAVVGRSGVGLVLAVAVGVSTFSTGRTRVAGVGERGRTGPRAFAASSGMMRRGSVAAQRDSAADLIRSWLGPAGVPGGQLLAPSATSRFYAARGYSPAWGRDAALEQGAAELVEALHGLVGDGLDPASCGLGAVQAALARLTADAPSPPVTDDAALELRLTDAFLACAGELLHGRVDARALYPGWTVPPRTRDLAAVLAGALERGDIAGALADVAPASTDYRQLRKALQRYRVIAAAGGWGPLVGTRTLRPGDRGDDVARLRRRLSLEQPVPPGGGVYDAVLDSAVQAYQRRRGLEADGVVGTATRAELDVTVTDRIRQIGLNLERLRWLPADLGAAYVEVLVPAFELRVIQEQRVVLAMRVIGGRADWPTPVFSAALSSVVFDPYWDIPARIMWSEVIPKVRRDPGYLDREGIRVLAGSGTAVREIDPRSIDWAAARPSNFGYWLRQDPGPLNPLGHLELVAPNRFDVFLHDTPARELFQRPTRALSHGCVRLENAMALVTYLIRGDPAWTTDSIRKAAAAGVEQVAPLADTLPLYVMYRTAWVDSLGAIEFRPDVYGEDARLARAMATAPDDVRPPPAVDAGRPRCTS